MEKKVLDFVKKAETSSFDNFILLQKQCKHVS